MALLPKRLRDRDQRGAALVEFAIAVPIFLALLALIFDAGLGYADSRSSASTARSAARVGALAGEARDADFRVLDAVRAKYINRDDVEVTRIVVYKSDAGDSAEATIGMCTASLADECNVYTGADLVSLSSATFGGVINRPGDDPLRNGRIAATDICDPDDIDAELCTCDSSPDEAWCPLDRRGDEGSYLGVYIETTSESTIGLLNDDFDLKDRAVFALYFPPLPVAADAAAAE